MKFARPLVRRFTWCDGHGNDWGLEGWQMKGFESLEPSSSFGVLHDALEHFDATLGMDAEMMAFGGILFGRWVYEDMHRHLADDVFEFIDRGAGEVSDIPTQGFLEIEDEQRIAKFFIEVKQQAHDKGIELDRDQPRRMIDWMRKGFRRHERRWAKAGGRSAFQSSFETYRNDKAFNHGEIGHTLTLRILGDGDIEIERRNLWGDTY